MLPKSFDFQNELQKGFFPHYLNTQLNLCYQSNDMPIVECFGVDEMGEEERKRFLEWHKEESLRLKNEGGMYDLRR